MEKILVTNIILIVLIITLILVMIYMIINLSSGDYECVIDPLKYASKQLNDSCSCWCSNMLK